MRVQAWHSIKLKEAGSVWCLVVNGEVEGEEAGDKVMRHGTCVKEKASKMWNRCGQICNFNCLFCWTRHRKTVWRWVQESPRDSARVV